MDIVQKDAPILRAIANDVVFEESSLSNILARMREALDACEDGVALAAPQIGESLRIFIVHSRAWKESAMPKDEPLVYINPTMTKRSKTKKEMDEGCLSVRGIYGKTKRSTRTTVEAFAENGKKFTRGASGLLAQIFQHEIDHLNGILFTDHATNLAKVEPKESHPQ